MRVIVKLYHAIAGIVLMVRYVKVFDIELLKGKRVALVGPASSAYETGRGDFINAFDYVIRINKAPSLLKEGKFKEDIGTKIDVLFHSFFENDLSGGGPLNFELYDALGIRYVINPIPTLFGKRATFNFYKKYLLKRPVYSLSLASYKDFVKAFGKFRPTTGFCAIYMVLQSEFSEFFITGYTFFKTPYGDGYRDSLKDVEANSKYIRDSNIHNPEIEYSKFKLLLEANKHKHIVTDKVLKQILETDGISVREA